MTIPDEGRTGVPLARIDKGAHMLLGDTRADGAEHGECAWTLLADNLFDASRYRVTRFERMPFPGWWDTSPWRSEVFPPKPALGAQ